MKLAEDVLAQMKMIAYNVILVMYLIVMNLDVLNVMTFQDILLMKSKIVRIFVETG